MVTRSPTWRSQPSVIKVGGVSEFLRVDNLADRSYIGSVIVNESNGRFYEPAPGRNYMVGLQAKLNF